MSDLTADRFSEFFRAVNGGHDPFPWQQRLVNELFASNGSWPRLLDLPTASGKTSTVDIALYTLAAGLEVPRRIVFVVDRRVIVQQSADHARRIQQRLRASNEPILQEVADALFDLHAATGSIAAAHPFTVAELRGAIEQDGTWAARPDVPAVIASTVDQVGSRLLYRGYGVSDRMKPVHAGLLGNDCLVLLDEVHLARPFAQLLATIRDRFRVSDSGLPERWQVAELSATPNADTPSEHRFQLEPADYAHDVLRRRLTATKPVRVVSISLPSSPERQLSALAAEHAKQARHVLAAPGVRTIAVIVNRVQLAVEVHARLTKQPELTSDSNEVLLVTGRMRGLDRDQIVQKVVERTSSHRTNDQGTTIVVATQTIEAGADLDFDAIVTDCASIDALIQRFGRVDRTGDLVKRLNGAERPTSVIVGSPKLTTGPDHVYGEAMAKTWEWLTSQTELDFGPTALQQLREAGALSPDLSTKPPRIMRLLRSHLDRLVRTSPIPDADVDIDRLLHGLDHEPNQEVEVIWRADLTEPMLYDAGKDFHTSRQTAIATLVETLPPMPGEAMSLPLSHVRDWLNTDVPTRDSNLAELSDIESSSTHAAMARGPIRPCILARGPNSTVTTSGRDIRPGESIIVPAEYGGVHGHTWSPASTRPVDDVLDVAAYLAGIVQVRLNPAVITTARPDAPVDQAVSSEPTREQAYVRRRALLRRPGDAADPTASIPTPRWVAAEDVEPTDAIIEFLVSDWQPVVEPGGSAYEDVRSHWRTACDDRKLTRSDLREVVSAFRSTDDDHTPISVFVATWAAPRPGASTTGPGSYEGGEYPLIAHLDDVRRWSAAIAQAVRLDDVFSSELATAGWLHDLGKADPRFQNLLREGRLLGSDAELLAKSAIPHSAFHRNILARERSGYPRGLRHEVASVALAPAATATVQYLVASHHGYARPFFPAQKSDPVNITTTGRLPSAETHDPYGWATIGGGSSEKFATAVTKFGYFGVGWLEALLRLADHAASDEAAKKSAGIDMEGTR